MRIGSCCGGGGASSGRRKAFGHDAAHEGAVLLLQFAVVAPLIGEKERLRGAESVAEPPPDFGQGRVVAELGERPCIRMAVARDLGF